MSDLRINIRFLFWHFQVKYNWRPRIVYNEYAFEHWKSALAKPIQVHDWDLK